MSPARVVSVVTRLQAEDLRNCGLILDLEQGIFLVSNGSDWLWGPSVLPFNGYGGFGGGGGVK